MEIEKDDYVINEKKTDWGTGKVIGIDAGYVHVIFEGLEGEKIFARDDHPLRRVNEPNHFERLERRLRSVMHTGQDLIILVERDRQNAIQARSLARKALSSIPRIIERPDIVSGESPGLVSQLRARERELMTLRAIEHDPFDAMVEVETLNSAGKTMEQLWYANEKSLLNTPLGMDAQRINVLAWTHPGVQMALAGDLEEPQDLRGCGYTLVEVTPRRRAKFTEVVPEISGLYEPGGSVRPHDEETPTAGLKAVKLDMTLDQVKAFISKMDGMMLVSGAPGSGKTTVALQRVRFLLDQQELRKESESDVVYEEGLTKIFLANRNLYEYSRQLLVENLGIAESVVELVKDFTTNYLNSVWVYKHKAQPRRKALFHLELRARQAIFGLCSEKDLIDIWRAYETQIAKRLKTAKAKNFGPRLAPALANQATASFQSNPFSSAFRMDRIYRKVGKEYESLRAALDQPTRKKFDVFFQQWIYWVYDPLDTVAGYFSKIKRLSEERIRKGTALAVREKEIITEVERDWKERRYGPEEEPWLAFLLRYALPEESEQKSKFREIPSAVPGTGIGEPGRWTHVVIDEAQDLSAPEASLLGSFVHPNGAMTASADFRQVVSPVHAIRSAEPFKVGCPLKDKGIFRSYPFAVNMRQCEQIGRFLQAFHQAAFGEMARFEVSNKIQETAKPELVLGPIQELVVHVKRRMAVLSRSQAISSVALLQINEDQEAMERLRNALEEQGVDLAPAWEAFDNKGRLVTTSVERIKGLEYDACFVIGMDDVERASLNFTKNRAYVALSRPARRLGILCQEFPMLLTRIDKRLYTETRLG